MELNIIKWWLLIVLVFYSCDNVSNNQKCEVRINSFLKKVSNYDVSIFYGLTLETRGVDFEGNRYLRDFEFKNRNGETVRLPSLQLRNKDDIKSLKNYDYYSYADELGIDSSSAKNIVENRIREISTKFLELDVFRITSQLHLGEFIEFEIAPNCSVWYKLDKAILNDTYKTLFDEAEKLKENWYAVKRRRIAPVLSEHPENVEIDN